MPRQTDIVASAPRGGRIVRPSPTTHWASTFPRAMLRYGALLRAPSASAGTDALPSSKVRSRYPHTRLSTLSRHGVPQAFASESRHPRRPRHGLPDWAPDCSPLIRVIGFNLLLLTLAWIVVEFVLTRRIPYQGWPAESGTEPTALYWIAC